MNDQQLNLPDGVPPLTQYYYYLTAGCNLACAHCWLSPEYQPKGTTGGHLDFELFKLSLEEGIPLGLTNAKLTGGEPLLHPDFSRMVDLLKEKNIGLTIETNGTLMTPKTARHLRASGILNHISVSLDGAIPETHDTFRGVPGAWEKAVAGIRMLVNEGINPQVIMSLHVGNVGELEDLVTQAEGWGVGSVKFNLIQPTGRGEKLNARHHTLDITQLVEIGRWVERDLQRRVRIPLFYSWPMMFYSLNRLVEHGSDACGIFHIMGVLANGSMAMCGIGMEIPELTYGVLGRDRVADVWTENQVLRDLRRDLPEKLEGVCGGCIFKWQCLGSCVAENFHQERKLTAPFWFCQQAKEIGLLPNNRTL